MGIRVRSRVRIQTIIRARIRVTIRVRVRARIRARIQEALRVGHCQSIPFFPSALRAWPVRRVCTSARRGRRFFLSMGGGEDDEEDKVAPLSAPAGIGAKEALI